MKNLWEVDHPYYCEGASYFGSGDMTTEHEYASWAGFIATMGNADEDMNLLFRWDWEEPHGHTEDDNYRDGKLSLFFFHQRKGFHSASYVQVCRNDQEAVRAYLLPKAAKMRQLWEPLL